MSFALLLVIVANGKFQDTGEFTNVQFVSQHYCEVAMPKVVAMIEKTYPNVSKVGATCVQTGPEN